MVVVDLEADLEATEAAGVVVEEVEGDEVDIAPHREVESGSLRERMPFLLDRPASPGPSLEKCCMYTSNAPISISILVRLTGVTADHSNRAATPLFESHYLSAYMATC